MSNNFGIARKFQPEEIPYDRREQRALVQSANQIRGIGDTTRVAMEEITTNFMVAEQYAAQGLTAAHCMASQVPQSEISQAFLQALTQNYLQRLLNVANIGNDAITRHAYAHTSNSNMVNRRGSYDY